MRLLTHNHLVCIVKDCSQNFPLKIEATKVEQDETDVNPEFVKHVLGSLEYSVLQDVAKQFSITIPEDATSAIEGGEDAIASLHKLLMDTHVEEGALCCQGCGRKYAISKGIPNMLLREDEL